jgi:hypothetical protein
MSISPLKLLKNINVFPDDKISFIKLLKLKKYKITKNSRKNKNKNWF